MKLSTRLCVTLSAISFFFGVVSRLVGTMADWPAVWHQFTLGTIFACTAMILWRLDNK